jgi:translation initiation factor 2 subunit 3
VPAEIITNQATLNIGTIGHVAHGKSQFVFAISGVRTGRRARERKFSRSLELGDANAKIYRCPTATNPAHQQLSPRRAPPH